MPIAMKALFESFQKFLFGQVEEQTRHLPWLMLPSHDPNTSSYLPFFNTFNKKIHHLDLPAAHQKICCGSSQGWLIMVDATSTIYLLNPLTRTNIQLPPITMFLDEFDSSSVGVVREKQQRNFSSSVHKVVLSSSPASNPDGYIAIAIYGEYRKLTCYKSGGKFWTAIEDSRSYYEDVVYHAKQFYAVDEYGGVVIVGVDPSPNITEVAPPWFFHGNQVYVVGVRQWLLLVIRYISKDADHVYKTTLFKVFKLSLTDCHWSMVNNLGNWMLFLGQNHSEAFLAEDFSQYRGNCIYFTDDYVEGHVDGIMGGHDFGVFNMEDCSIEELSCHQGNSKLILPPPIWVKLDP